MADVAGELERQSATRATAAVILIGGAAMRQYPRHAGQRDDVVDDRRLTEQTLQQLQSLNLLEMARKWQEQQRDPQMAELSFDERFGLLVDSQSLSQHNKRIARLL